DLLARRIEADEMIDGGADGARRARALRLLLRVGLEHVFVPVDLDAEAERRAVHLPLIDEPRSWCRAGGIEHAVYAPRPAEALVGIRLVLAEAVREPGRVRHLVERVHVRRFVRRIDGEDLRERTENAVVDPVPGERRDVRLRGARDVARVLLRRAALAL